MTIIAHLQTCVNVDHETGCSREKISNGLSDEGILSLPLKRQGTLSVEAHVSHPFWSSGSCFCSLWSRNFLSTFFFWRRIMADEQQQFENLLVNLMSTDNQVRSQAEVGSSPQLFKTDVNPPSLRPEKCVLLNIAVVCLLSLTHAGVLLPLQRRLCITRLWP